MRRVSATEAKANFSALIAQVAHGGQQVVIQCRGTPMAALVSVEDLERLGGGSSGARYPGGALALVGLWDVVEDETIDALVEDIYRSRYQDKGRSVILEG